MEAQPASALIGHQEYVQAGGQPVLTLRELWPTEPRAMIVGLNPSPPSVAAGHYYQGRLGPRRMDLLAAAGLFHSPGPNQFVDDVALTKGIGFADLVRRPTSGEKDLSENEIREGAQRLRRKLVERRVPLVVCVFRHPALELTGSPKNGAKPGVVPAGHLSGSTVFRMPGPFAAKATAQHVMDELSGLLNSLSSPLR